MENKTYTQKELYQFVTEYSREAREEGFDMSVGDFVDWVASRDEKQEECSCHCHNNHEGCNIPGSDIWCKCLPMCKHCVPNYEEQIIRKASPPVLPEKISDTFANVIGASPNIYTVIDKVDAVIDYLSRKEQ